MIYFVAFFLWAEKNVLQLSNFFWRALTRVLEKMDHVVDVKQEKIKREEENKIMLKIVLISVVVVLILLVLVWVLLLIAFYS